MPALSNLRKINISLNALCWLILIASCILFIFLIRYPVNSSKLSMLTLATAIVAWLCMIVLTRKFRTPCSLLVVVPIVSAAIIAYAPERTIKEDALREKYVENLQSYEGVDYYWGGENNRGIDCSGLPRKSYRLAMLKEGLIRANPALVRESFLHWWNDAGAEALRDGYREYLQPIGIEGVLKDIPTQKLLPGDLAITRNGRHVIVYLGDNRWIQADPSTNKVHTLNAKEDQNVWFGRKITMLRWSQLPLHDDAK